MKHCFHFFLSIIIVHGWTGCSQTEESGSANCPSGIAQSVCDAREYAQCTTGLSSNDGFYLGDDFKQPDGTKMYTIPKCTFGDWLPVGNPLDKGKWTLGSDSIFDGAYEAWTLLDPQTLKINFLGKPLVFFRVSHPKTEVNGTLSVKETSTVSASIYARGISDIGDISVILQHRKIPEAFIKTTPDANGSVHISDTILPSGAYDITVQSAQGTQSFESNFSQPTKSLGSMLVTSTGVTHISARVAPVILLTTDGAYTRKGIDHFRNNGTVTLLIFVEELAISDSINPVSITFDDPVITSYSVVTASAPSYGDYAKSVTLNLADFNTSSHTVIAHISVLDPENNVTLTLDEPLTIYRDKIKLYVTTDDAFTYGNPTMTVSYLNKVMQYAPNSNPDTVFEIPKLSGMDLAFAFYNTSAETGTHAYGVGIDAYPAATRYTAGMIDSLTPNEDPSTAPTMEYNSTYSVIIEEGDVDFYRIVELNVLP